MTLNPTQIGRLAPCEHGMPRGGEFCEACGDPRPAVSVAFALGQLGDAWRGDWTGSEFDGRDGSQVIDYLVERLEAGESVDPWMLEKLTGRPFCVTHACWFSSCEAYADPRDGLGDCPRTLAIKADIAAGREVP